jgi:hypothetical protein
MDGFNIQIFPIVRDGEFTLFPFHGSMSFRRITAKLNNTAYWRRMEPHWGCL